MSINPLFNPNDYIEHLDDDHVLCNNPLADGGLSSITVNLSITEASKENFRNSVRRMVLNKLFSPKFAEVIMSALEMQPATQQQRA
jgi:hypothetical protein